MMSWGSKRAQQIIRALWLAVLAWHGRAPSVDAFLSRGAWFTRAVEGEDGAVYVGSVNHHVYAFYPQPTCAGGQDAGTVCTSDAECRDGICTRVKWILRTKNDVYADPVIAPSASSAPGTIFVGSTDRYLYAIDPEPDASCVDGNRELGCFKWTAKTGVMVARLLIRLGSGAAPDTLFVATRTSYNNLYAFNLDSPDPRWVMPMPGGLRFNPLLTGDARTLYLGSNLRGLFAVDVAGDNHALLWALYYPTCPSPAETCQFLRSGDLGPDGTIYAGAEGNVDTAKVVALAPNARKCSNAPSVSCVSDADCPVGGNCKNTLNMCSGSPNAGQSCTSAAECPGGECQPSPCVEPLGPCDEIARCDFCLRWDYPLQAERRSGTVLGLDGSTVFRGTRHERSIEAIGATDGVQKWSLDVGGPVESLAAVHPGGRVRFGSADPLAGVVFIGVTAGHGNDQGTFYAIAPCDPAGSDPPVCPDTSCAFPKILWTFSRGAEFRTTPGFSRDLETVYTGDDLGKQTFYALAVDDGRVEWCYDTTQDFRLPNGQSCDRPDRPPCCEPITPNTTITIPACG